MLQFTSRIIYNKYSLSLSPYNNNTRWHWHELNTRDETISSSGGARRSSKGGNTSVSVFCHAAISHIPLHFSAATTLSAVGFAPRLGWSRRKTLVENGKKTLGAETEKEQKNAQFHQSEERHASEFRKCFDSNYSFLFRCASASSPLPQLMSSNKSSDTSQVEMEILKWWGWKMIVKIVCGGLSKPRLEQFMSAKRFVSSRHTTLTLRREWNYLFSIHFNRAEHTQHSEHEQIWNFISLRIIKVCRRSVQLADPFLLALAFFLLEFRLTCTAAWWNV